MAEIIKNLNGDKIEYLVRRGGKTIFRGTKKGAEEFLNPLKNKKTKAKKKSKGK